MRSHRARPVTLVEPAAHVLGRHLEVAVAPHREGLCWSHGGKLWSRRVCAVESMDWMELGSRNWVVRHIVAKSRSRLEISGSEKLRRWRRHGGAAPKLEIDRGLNAWGSELRWAVVGASSCIMALATARSSKTSCHFSPFGWVG